MTRKEYDEYVRHLVAQMQRDTAFYESRKPGGD